MKTIKWLSAYETTFEKEDFENTSTFATVTILQGLEQYIRACLQSNETSDFIRKQFFAQCEAWLAWEQTEPERTLILIGNDLSKGVVPVEKENRLWRDVTGWCYQDLTTMAAQVDLIWYGIATRLKG